MKYKHYCLFRKGWVNTYRKIDNGYYYKKPEAEFHNYPDLWVFDFKFHNWGFDIGFHKNR